MIYKRRYTTLQKRYLNDRKTDRPRNQKREQSVQVELATWFKQVLPGEHFRSDTGSGAYNSEWIKEQHNRQQSYKEEPDITILAARRGYHAMVLELKADCPHGGKHTDCMIRMQRDGRTIKVYKDKKGRIIERDYKVRKKGDYINLHVERQAQNLLDYEKKGYFSRFGLGLEHSKKLIRWYFSLPDEDTATLF